MWHHISKLCQVSFVSFQAVTDIQHLHLTLSEWSELPVVMWDMQAVWMEGKLYVGGGETSDSYRDDASLYVYTPTSDGWDILETPAYAFALTTYCSQLVLAGGFEYVGETEADREPTNKLWTLNAELEQWQRILPPMPTNRCGASDVDVVGAKHPHNKFAIDISPEGKYIVSLMLCLGVRL